MSYPYIDQLKDRLDEWKKINDTIDSLNRRRTQIRKQIQQWMKLNSLESFELEVNDKVWSISFQTKTSRKPNWHLIHQHTPPEVHDQLIITSKSDPFVVIREIKHKHLTTNNSPFESTQPLPPTAQVQ